MDLQHIKNLSPTAGHLYGFIGTSVGVKFLMKFPIILGDELFLTTNVVDFMVFNQTSAYKAIVRRLIMKEIRVVISIYHLSMKFPNPNGIGCVRGIQYESRDCYNKALHLAERRNKPIPEDTYIDEDERTIKGATNSTPLCNEISIEEILENYFKNMRIHVELIPRII